MTTNNSTNYSVKELVAKYRNYVKEHCPLETIPILNSYETVEIANPFSPKFHAEEQLLTVIYKTVAGNCANPEITKALSEYAESFYKDALNEKEILYLCSNFKEFVSYMFSHREEWNENPCTYSITKERMRLIKEFIHPETGSTIFVADTELCDLAVLFSGCVVYGFTGHNEYNRKEIWALGQIRMYAAGIETHINSGEEINDNYIYSLPQKGSVDYIICGCNGSLFSECKDIEELYDLLKPEGKMFFFTKKRKMAEKNKNSYLEFRKRIVKEKAVEAIVAYKDYETIISLALSSRLEKKIGEDSIMLVISKIPHTKVFVKNETTKFAQDIDVEELDAEILWPSFYAAKRPKCGISLSKIVTFKELKKKLYKKNKDKYVLPKSANNSLVVVPKQMSQDYKNANLNKVDLKRASSLELDEDSKNFFYSIDQPCVLLFGTKDIYILGYIKEIPKDGLATYSFICLIPQKGIDVRYVAAVLMLPEVKNQIITICEGEVDSTIFPLIMDKIIIPYHNEKEQLKFLAEANYDAMLASQEELKKNNEDYKKGVRMRKHAITQSMSSIESMFNALNSYRKRQDGSISSSDRISRITETTVDDAFNFLEERIKYIMPAIEHLADVEYSFGNAENIDPEEFISSYISRNKGGWTKFAVIMNSNDNYVTTYRPIPKSNSVKIQNEDAEPLLIPKLYFPKSALERIFNNIFSNAQSHGFTDKNRSDYKIRISWLYDGINLKIEIENNGQPLPDDRPISSLFEYGVSNSLHKDGHNGIGLNEIEEIMNRFDGKVNIVSSPIEDFTVKYILTFPTNMVPIKDITFAERTNNKA